jgi:hypothetical protein
MTETPTVTGASVVLNGRVDIYPAMPLPEFDSVGGPAFAARMRGEMASDLIAIVCNTNMPARFESLAAMRSINNSSLLRMVESGVVGWPNGQRFYVFVYERPPAPRFATTLDIPHTSMSEDAINHHFLAPLIGVLSEFMRTGIFHGAIRSTNLYWRAGSTTPPQLGEFLSGPAGVGQPALFETIERGMAIPLGRGNGSHTDDCYAFGVMAALLIIGHNPLKTLDDRAIVQMKMERGSFNTLVGSHRLSATHIEFLRGLLTDDSRQRWTAGDLDQWINGRRLTPKGTDLGRRASRHFEFVGKEYWQTRPLANAFANHIHEAVGVIENGSLDKWLRRSLGDDDRGNEVGEALLSLKASGRTAHYEDQLVARACIALDPAAPIRYRGLTLMPTGIPAMLAEAIASGGNPSILADIITSQLVTFWVEAQKELKTDLVPLAQHFERLGGMIEKTSYGNGLERAMYELNPAMPCLSPMLRDQCVVSTKALLPALERAAGLAGRPREPMDRHIAAFLVVRDRRSEMLLEPMTAGENSPRRGLAMLTLYSEMQSRYGPDSLPQLARWLAPFLEGSVQRYFGKALRETMQKHLQDTVERGNLDSLVRFIDDPAQLERDQQEFMAARMLYLNILKEINQIEGKMSSRESVVQSTGKPIAATLAMMLALLLVIAAVARAVWVSI